MRNRPRLFAVIPALVLGCGTDLVAPRNASPTEGAESFPCGLRVPELAREGAPPTGPSCEDGRVCTPSEVCQRLLDDPAEEPLCVTAEAPRITTAVMEVGLGRSRFEVIVEDDNRDATTVTLSVLDADGDEVAAPSSGLLGTHALTGTGVRRSASSPYLLTEDYGQATHARFVARDASGRSATRVVPFTPARYRREQESCLDGALCAPGLCCWYHYSAAICRRDCSH